MFFNSSTFLFGFLPIVLAGFFLLERTGSLVARQAWLLAASLVFYAWSNSTVLALFLPLTAINYLLGSRLQRSGSNGGKWLLALVVGFNVLALCYFKYANFFVTNLNAVLQTNLFIEKILLPLGISFITFMQIAWLVATSQAICMKVMNEIPSGSRIFSMKRFVWRTALRFVTKKFAYLK